MSGKEGAVVITSVHKHIHDGRMYSVDMFQIGVVDDGFLEALIQIPAPGTPALEEIHARWIASASHNNIITIYEDTTSLPGSPLLEHIPVNRNRSGVIRATTVKVYEAPAVSSPLGVLIGGPVYSPGGTGGNAVGGKGEGFGELILPAGKDYLVRMQNIGGAAADMHLQLDFYEEFEQ